MVGTRSLIAATAPAQNVVVLRQFWAGPGPLGLLHASLL